MTISKEILLKRKEEIVTQIKAMQDNRSALAGALQQVDLFIKQIEDDGDPMPEEKRQALEMATS